MLLNHLIAGENPSLSFIFFLCGLLGFIFVCLIVFGSLPQSPVGSAERGDSLATGSHLLLVHLPFPLPSPLSQGETASAEMVSLPNEERSEESSYLCVVVFSNGKLRGPVLTLTPSQGLQRAFCCPVSSF